MSFINNFLTPLIQLSVYLFMILGITFLTYIIFKKMFKEFRWILKYKIFRRNYDSQKVQWCMDAIKKELTPVEIKKILLIKGYTLKEVSEMVYIYNTVKKEMKGGIKNE